MAKLPLLNPSQNSYPPARQPLGRAPLGKEAEAKLGQLGRIVLLMIALLMLAPLILAWSLKPDPSGMGTHQQIPGFGPCTIQTLFGFPCPACGMTTSWSLATQGQVVAALMTSASGTILAAVFAVASIWLLAVAIRGRWLVMAPTPLQVAIAAMAWLALVMVEWLARRGPEIFG